MAESKTKPSRLWKIVLVTSLALNLAVAGVVVGAVMSGRMGDGPPRSFDLGVGPMARALTPQERRQVGRALRQDRALRDVDLRARVGLMADALRAEPFEPETLRVLLVEQNAQLSRVQSKAQDGLLATIEAMTPARRAAFAEALLAEQAKARDRQPRPASGG